MSHQMIRVPSGCRVAPWSRSPLVPKACLSASSIRGRADMGVSPGLLLASLAAGGCLGDPGSDPFGSEPWIVTGPEPRIGSLDDPEYIFGQVGNVLPGPDGFIYSVHLGEGAVRRWSADGTPAGSVGRRGEGPGEFLQPGRIGFFGDSLWIMDSRSYRVGYFDPSGTWLGTASPRVGIEGPGGASLRPSAPLRDGTFTAQASTPLHLVATGQLTEGPFVRIDTAGNVLASIWNRRHEPRDILALMGSDGFSGTFSGQPFVDSPLSITRERGVFVVDRRAWTGAGQAAVKVTLIGFEGDTLFTSDIPYTPSPLPSDRVDSAVRAIAERMSRFSEGRIREAVYHPSHVPPIGGVSAGSDGTIWLRRFDPVETETGDRMVEWWILDAGGEPLARALTPLNLRVRAIDSDAMWGVESDELGVQYIVRYRLVKGG